MNTVATHEAFITAFVRENKDKIRRILEDGALDIVEKTTLLRRIGRSIAEKHGGTMHFKDLEDFEAHYDRGETPLTHLEGEGFRDGDVFILKACPMVPVFGEFKENGIFPEFWSSTTREYTEQFKNEALLHPLCIVHQTFRDILTSKIPKGRSYVHSVTVACRSGASGEVVHSNYGMKLAGVTAEEINEKIDGWACAFYAR